MSATTDAQEQQQQPTDAVDPVVIFAKRNGTPDKRQCNAYKNKLVDEHGTVVSGAATLRSGTRVQLCTDDNGTLMGWNLSPDARTERRRERDYARSIETAKGTLVECLTSHDMTVWWWPRQNTPHLVDGRTFRNVYKIHLDRFFTYDAPSPHGRQIRRIRTIGVRRDNFVVDASPTPVPRKKSVTRHLDDGSTLRVRFDRNSNVRVVDRTCQAYRRNLVNIYGVPYKWACNSSRQYVQSIQCNYVAQRVIRFVDPYDMQALSKVNRYFCKAVLDKNLIATIRSDCFHATNAYNERVEWIHEQSKTLCDGPDEEVLARGHVLENGTQRRPPVRTARELRKELLTMLHDSVWNYPLAQRDDNIAWCVLLTRCMARYAEKAGRLKKERQYLRRCINQRSVMMRHLPYLGIE